MKTYVISSLDNAENVRKLITELTKHGCEITYDWTKHGRVYDTDLLLEIADNEINGVISADLVIFLPPVGNGSNIELGVAIRDKLLNNNKKIIIVMNDVPVTITSFYYSKHVLKLNMEEIINFVRSSNELHNSH